MKVNLLGLDAAALGGFFADRGEKPFRARQVLRWVHQLGESDFARMTDLARGSREMLAAAAEVLPPAMIADDSGRRRHAQMAARRRQGQRRRDGLHPGSGARDALRLDPGGLHHGLPVLLDRPAGVQPQPRDGGDRRPVVACEPCAGRHARRRSRHQQRRADGHGGAAAQLRQRPAGAAPDAGRPRLRAVAAPGHALDRRASCR